MSVDFDPVRLGPRRRRVDPVAAGVLVVIAALVVAVVKPWAPSERVDRPGPSAAIAVLPLSVTPEPSPSPGRPQPPATPVATPPPTWSDIAPVLDVHRDWGVEAVLLLPATTASQGRPSRFVSYWAPAAPGPDGPQSAYVAREDQSIVALGVTYPADDVPLDARIWLVHADDQLEWMDARLVVGGAPDGAMLFERPGGAGAAPNTWPGGHYRIDVLVGGQVRRIAVQIPGRLGSVSQPDVWPPNTTGIVVPAASDPSSVRAGLFATVNGRGVPLAATPGLPLDEAAAWLRAVGRGQSTGATVARAYLPLATGLGVMLTSHAALDSAVIHRLAPDDRFDPGPLLGGISKIQGRTPYVVFAPRDGSTLTPGVYALTIAFTDGRGSHTETWQVELRPGPAEPTAGVAG